MTQGLHILLSLAAVAHTETAAATADGGSGLLIGLAAALVAAGGTALWAFLQLKAARRRLDTLRIEHQSTTAAHRGLLDRDRQHTKALEERRAEVTTLKQELAGQKKKNHSLQEEMKKVRAELRTQTEAAERARASRPAFEDRPAATLAKPAAKPAATHDPGPEPKRAEPAAPPEAAAPQPAPVGETASDRELAERLGRLEEENRGLGERLESQRRAAREEREELSRLRKRVEGMRRIDLISKGKIEVLTDKINAVGRQYYDAVSELAALKGEVQPPMPRELRAARPAGVDARDDAAEDADEDAFEAGAETEPEPRHSKDTAPGA